ncbi:MAG TPA: hypothetical protein DCX34_11130 [Roseovarius sp.]|nr:hypothetical protein [Roseovarius sp.]
MSVQSSGYRESAVHRPIAPGSWCGLRRWRGIARLFRCRAGWDRNVPHGRAAWRRPLRLRRWCGWSGPWACPPCQRSLICQSHASSARRERVTSPACNKWLRCAMASTSANP